MKNLLIINKINNVGIPLGEVDTSEYDATEQAAHAALEAGVTTPNYLTVEHNTNKDFINIIAGNGANVLPDIFRISRKALSFTKSTTVSSTQFVATVTCAISAGHNYNENFVIITKKGTVFNERNNWTISGHGTSANDIAADLAKNINRSSATSGITATVASNVVTLTGSDNVDYAVKASRVSIGTSSNEYAKSEAELSVSVTSHGAVGIGTPEYVEELAMACMGDKGVESTYVSALGMGTKESNHFTAHLGIDASKTYVVYTINYYNPRHDHNIDEPLMCKLHIAIASTETSGMTNLEKALNNQSLS